MSTASAPGTTLVYQDQPDLGQHDVVARLRGHWLILARMAWVVVAVLAIGLMVASLPSHYARTADFSDPTLRDRDAVRAGLRQLGIPASAYAAYTVALDVLFAAIYVAVALVLFRRKSDEVIVLLVSLTFVTFGTTWPQTLSALTADHPSVQAIAWFVKTYGWLSFFPLLYLFPDGRFIPRWTWMLTAIWVTFGLINNVMPNSHLNPATWSPLLGQPGLYVLWLSMAASQIYRYRRCSGPIQRQQTKWAAFGFALFITVLVLANVVDAVVPAFHRPGITAAIYSMASIAVYVAVPSVLPVAVGVGILRYRLWDIDIIINRAVLYAVLTGCLVGLYTLIVGGLGWLFRSGGTFPISLLATALVTVLFQPLRQRLQRGLNRLLYGERDDPYVALTRLGQRLEGTLAPDAVLPTVAVTVRDALRLPYAAIVLHREDGSSLSAEAGEPVPALERVPLIYQGETVGEFLLAPRARGEEFGSADRRLIHDLARQVGIAAHAVRLTADLQRSRERLVAAREEERRRLRRDLHDGLGPLLGSLTLKLGAARKLMYQDLAAADTLMIDLKGQTQQAVEDVRHLVYALRPPALDELGLVGAVRQIASGYDAAGDTQTPEITVEAPETLPPLPAAVEVAAYHIALEAMTNAVRHAGARTCVIRLISDEAAGLLRLEVRDDGRGLPADARAGVGLRSMRERAAELGGSWVVEAGPRGGTLLRAVLPYAATTAPVPVGD